VTWPNVASDSSCDAEEFVLRYRATAPATCGDAMDVPLIVFVAVLEFFQADVIPDPGAKISTQVPKFEYEARASLDVVAPTVIAALTRAGE